MVTVTVSEHSPSVLLTFGSSFFLIQWSADGHRPCYYEAVQQALALAAPFSKRPNNASCAIWRASHQLSRREFYASSFV